MPGKTKEEKLQEEVDRLKNELAQRDAQMGGGSALPIGNGARNPHFEENFGGFIKREHSPADLIPGEIDVLATSLSLTMTPDLRSLLRKQAVTSVIGLKTAKLVNLR